MTCKAHSVEVSTLCPCDASVRRVCEWTGHCAAIDVDSECSLCL